MQTHPSRSGRPVVVCGSPIGASFRSISRNRALVRDGNPDCHVRRWFAVRAATVDTGATASPAAVPTQPRSDRGDTDFARDGGA